MGRLEGRTDPVGSCPIGGILIVRRDWYWKLKKGTLVLVVLKGLVYHGNMWKR